MPRPPRSMVQANRRLRDPNRGKTTAPKLEYFILDPNCKEIAGRRIIKGERSVMLAEHEALHFLANGSVSLNDPKADEAARKAVAGKGEPAGEEHHHGRARQK